MADHPIRAFLNYSGTWAEVTTDVSQVEAVTLAQGGSEVSAAPKTSTVDLTFEDPNGVYRPYLPSSPLFDLAGRNTPLLIGADMGTEDFEDTTFTFTWGFAGTGVWARSSTQAHAGTWSFKSPVIANGQQGNWQIDMPTGTTTLVFWYWVDISTDSFLAVYNAEFDLMFSTSGNSGGWHQATVDMSGSNSVLFSYQRNNAAGTNACYVDDLLALAGQIGEVAAWEPDETLGAGTGRGRRWTDVTAQGLLGRIGRWTEPITSAYLRQLLLTPGMIDLWTCEDPKTPSAVNSSGVITQGADTFEINPIQAIGGGYTFGADDSPAGGSGRSMRIETSGSLVGYFQRSTIEYQIGIAFKLKDVANLPNPGGAFLDSVLISWADTLGWSWWIMINHDSYSLLVTDDRGATVVYDSNLYGTGADPDQWIMMVLKATYSGGTRTYDLRWVPEGGTTVYINGGSFAGPAGAPTYWTMGGGYFGMAGGFIGYVYLTSDTSAVLTGGPYQDAFNGYPGERAGTRFLRLLSEQGLSGIVSGEEADTEPMGAQRPDTLANLLREIRDTEGGTLTDSPGQVAVSLRTRRSLYNQATRTLTSGSNVASPFKPILDDLNTHNLITVSQRDGGTATAEDTTSSMGTQAPPTGVGTYKQSIDVNVANEARLAEMAGWWLSVGTNPEPRFAAVTVDLDANPELAAAATAVRGGDRITISGYLPDAIDLIVIGKTDNRANQKRRTVTFTCAPYRPFAVAVYDDTGRRADSNTSTLNAGYTTTASPMVVTFTDLRDQWSTVNAPYDWIVAGERITVTSMGAVTGSGPWTQSATVTRSVNGVVKAHSAGEPVHMHPDQQARYAL